MKNEIKAEEKRIVSVNTTAPILTITEKIEWDMD
jgi:hypothetical protein